MEMAVGRANMDATANAETRRERRSRPAVNFKNIHCACMVVLQRRGRRALTTHSMAPTVPLVISQ